VKNSADRHVNRLLRGRRPRRFAASDEDAARIRTAIELVSSRQEEAGPSDAFVGGLRARLAAEQSDGAGLRGASGLSGGFGRFDRPGRQPKRRLLMSLRRDRRRVLRAGLLTATAFAAGIVTEPLLTPDSGTDPAARTELLPSHGTWHTVTAGDRLPEGAVLDFDLGTVSGFVHRTSGHLQAMSGTCTHQGCRLGLDDARSTLVCPCHGATFTLNGDPLRNFHSHQPLPALPRLAVREHNGQVQVYGPATPPPATRA
jgi:nitrite reductase/ring-hydroxylating ferredoxin subunit